MDGVWGPRINLTFRYIKCHTKGRACCGAPASRTPHFVSSFPHSWTESCAPPSTSPSASRAPPSTSTSASHAPPLTSPCASRAPPSTSPSASHAPPSTSPCASRAPPSTSPSASHAPPSTSPSASRAASTTHVPLVSIDTSRTHVSDAVPTPPSLKSVETRIVVTLLYRFR